MFIFEGIFIFWVIFIFEVVFLLEFVFLFEVVLIFEVIFIFEVKYGLIRRISEQYNSPLILFWLDGWLDVLTETVIVELTQSS